MDGTIDNGLTIGSAEYNNMLKATKFETSISFGWSDHDLRIALTHVII